MKVGTQMNKTKTKLSQMARRIVSGVAAVVIGLTFGTMGGFANESSPKPACQQVTNASGLGWKESYIGGSPAAEAAFVQQAVKDINALQKSNKKESKANSIKRGFHAKIHAGITNAKFVIAQSVPPQLSGGLFQPGKAYATAVRFSNASGMVKADKEADLRGLALKVTTDDGVQDFLGTNGKINHVKDAREFIEFAKAMASENKLQGFATLISKCGFFETVRMFQIAIPQVSRKVPSLATETYFSRAPIAYNGYAFKYQLTPTASSKGLSVGKTDNYLREELVDRLKKGPVVFDYQVQFFSNEKETSIEDGTAEWKTPLITVAQLVIPQQDLTTSEAAATQQAVDKFEFNPWNDAKGLVPLGNANRTRRLVYPASAKLRKS